MHLLVLSAFRRSEPSVGVQDYAGGSQCTFWCSVLSDLVTGLGPSVLVPVSMHLLVLSAFRPGKSCLSTLPSMRSQCTFWCSVLSDPEVKAAFHSINRSQCTFWCSVLSDRQRKSPSFCAHVSMHLLVLSAFRRRRIRLSLRGVQSLNAPSGAQCFPTLSGEPVGG